MIDHLAIVTAFKLHAERRHRKAEPEELGPPLPEEIVAERAERAWQQYLWHRRNGNREREEMRVEIEEARRGMR